jgi:hypothetical protein
LCRPPRVMQPTEESLRRPLCAPAGPTISLSRDWEEVEA